MARRINHAIIATLCAVMIVTTSQSAVAAPNATNVAIGATVTVSSSHNDPAYSPLFAIDGTYGVPWGYEWVAAYDDNAQWITLSWAAEQTLTNICLFDSAETDAQATNVRVELNDGYTQSGISLPNDGQSGYCITLTGPHIHINWLKVSILGHIGLPRIAEIAAIGSPTAPPTATATSTAVPPTATATSTAVPPTATATTTAMPPTATATSTAVPEVTATPAFFRGNTYIPVASFKTYHCVTLCHFRAVIMPRAIRLAVNGTKRVSMYLRINAYKPVHLHRVYGSSFILSV